MELVTLFPEEWLALKVGWNCKQICHHCNAKKIDYACVPGNLNPRRDEHNFREHACRKSECGRIDRFVFVPLLAGCMIKQYSLNPEPH